MIGTTDLMLDELDERCNWVLESLSRKPPDEPQIRAAME